MMAAALKPLIERLPPVRGSLESDAPLGAMTWFKTGGAAEILFRPADEGDLAEFLHRLETDIPLTVIGIGSNLLIRDGGVDGVVVKLGKAFASIAMAPPLITVGAGATDIAVASAARDAGLGGLEFLRGVPGSIGGALRMNAGAYGREMKDIVVTARAIDRTGRAHELDSEDLGYGYRTSQVPEDLIFVAATLRGRSEDSAVIARRMSEIAEAREDSQPLRTRTGGSTFKNPDPAISGGRRAWQLIEQAGMRGAVIGDAQVSEKHCNFLINRGAATSADLERLGETVRERVHETTGVILEWEIRRIGLPLRNVS